MTKFHRSASASAFVVIAASFTMTVKIVVAQHADTYAVYATESGACDAAPESKVEISEGRIVGADFACDLGEASSAGSGLASYEAACVVDNVASAEPVTFDLGNYSDHFEVALPGRDDWLPLYPCTPVPGLQTAAPEPSNWTCRNADIEVVCADDSCRVTDAHTPMEVTVSGSEVSVCAYSGCWEGAAATTVRSGSFLTVTGTGLPFSSDPDDRADISVTIETASRVGTILVAGRYATPATCY